MTMTDEQFIACVQGTPVQDKVTTSIFEEVCSMCGGYRVVDNGFDELGGKYARCFACNGKGHVLVERPVETKPERVIR